MSEVANLATSNTTFRHFLCKDVNSLNSSQRCHFVSTARDCQNDLSYIDYISFIYCAFPFHREAPIIVCIIWMLILFVALGVTATDFLCPALFVISKSLRLDQNVAGVTLLAFGNGSPDIFSAIAGIRQGKPLLVVGGLFGGGTFVTMCVAGSIFIVNSFKLSAKPFFRDVIFYLIAISWIFYLFIWEKQIRIYDSIGLLMLYLIYVAIVVIEKCFSKNPKEEEQKGEIEVTFHGIELDKDPAAEMVVLKNFSLTKANQTDRSPRKSILKITQSKFENSNVLNVDDFLTMDEVRRPSKVTIKSDVTHYDDNSKRESKSPSIFSISQNYLLQIKRQSIVIFEKISPFHLNGWKYQNWGGKYFENIKAPIRYFLLLTTPMTDVEGNKTWNKRLSAWHCITGPLFILFATGYGMEWICDTIPFAVILLVTSSLTAIIVLVTSSHEYAPKYYKTYSAYLGFVVGVTWIFCISNEVVGLLRSIGIAFNLSDEIIGLTILAWGNSLLDFISNFSIAKKGLPRMAIAACFGAPLLGLLIGVGFPTTLQLLTHPGQTIQLASSKLIVVIYVALAGGLCLTLTQLSVFKFQTKKWYGPVLIGIYICTMLVAILCELRVIHF